MPPVNNESLPRDEAACGRSQQGQGTRYLGRFAKPMHQNAIEKLRLNAGLVTLSACDTGVGPVGEDGVDNIVNAFIEAGAETVVSTLWELEDHSTEHLMAAFYSRLSKGEPKGQALREAQSQLIKEGLQPYYWASFQLVGDPNGTI